MGIKTMVKAGIVTLTMLVSSVFAANKAGAQGVFYWNSYYGGAGRPGGYSIYTGADKSFQMNVNIPVRTQAPDRNGKMKPIVALDSVYSEYFNDPRYGPALLVEIWKPDRESYVSAIDYVRRAAGHYEPFDVFSQYVADPVTRETREVYKKTAKELRLEYPGWYWDLQNKFVNALNAGKAIVEKQGRDDSKGAGNMLYDQIRKQNLDREIERQRLIDEKYRKFDREVDSLNRRNDSLNRLNQGGPDGKTYVVPPVDPAGNALNPEIMAPPGRPK